MTTTDPVAPAAPAAPSAAATASSDPAPSGWFEPLVTLGGLATFLVLETVFLTVLRTVSPRFFWIDDQQVQYVPAFRWLGEHRRDGLPPLFDPDLGAAGNFLADPQYGVLDPVHWLVWSVVEGTRDLVEATWLVSGAAVLVLGAGVLLLLRQYGAPVLLALATALAVASSGFALWFGASWWPLLWSTAWLPWLWLGLAVRRWPGAVCAGVAAYLLGAAGYPYNLVVAGALVLASGGEWWWRGRGQPGGRSWRGPLLRLVAAAGGLLASGPGLVAAQQLSPYTQRTAPDSGFGNIGILIPNALDAALGGQTLTLSLSGSWGGSLIAAPVAAAALFAVPALALVDWRPAVRRPGVLTALTMTALSLVLTQLPTYVGPFRYPFRYLVAVQLFVSLLAVIGFVAASRVTRRRLLLAGGLVLAQFLLALGRAPSVWGWHLLALAAGGLAVAALAGLASSRRRLAGAAAVAVLVATAAGPFLGLGSATTLGRLDQSAQDLETTGLPARQLPERPDLGTTVAEFRAQLVAPDEVLTIPIWGGFGEEDGWAGGVLPGNANLVADMRPGFGYIASGQRAWVQRWCLDYISAIRTSASCVRGLMAPVPGTDVPWVDAMSADRVLLSPSTPRAVRRYFETGWTQGEDVGTFASFRRPRPLASRVTSATAGVTALEDVGPGDRPAYPGEPLNTYRVSTDADGGDLVLRVPWWPGLTATVDGRPVTTSAVRGTVLRVSVPGGLDDAQLEVRYEPAGVDLLVPAWVAGGLLVLAAAGAELVVSRRRRSAVG